MVAASSGALGGCPVTAFVAVGASEIVRGDIPGGPSTSQTIMVDSLATVLGLLPPDAVPADYRAAILNDNVLGKGTARAREWAFRQLRRFYGLDPSLVLFRALRDLWSDESCGRPLLALLCAMARDPVLRASASLVLMAESGAVIAPEDFEKVIDTAFPDAYRASTRRATAQKLASSWHQSGHLVKQSSTVKTRGRAVASPAAVAYALLLGHVQGAGGAALFGTQWAIVLDQAPSRLIDLAVTASQRGLIEFRHSGGVIEVGFGGLLRPFSEELR